MVKKPSHYCLQYSFPEGSASPGGGSCKGSMQGGTCVQGKIQNALERLESVACDCVLVLMTVLTLKCYSFYDSKLSE